VKSRRTIIRPIPPPVTLASALRQQSDPGAFLEERLNFCPDPWQARLLCSPEPRIILNCSRQSGKSTIAAGLAVHTVVFVPDALVLLVSPTLRQSKELFYKCTTFIRKLQPAEILEEDNRLSCTLQNGSRIVSLPGDERTIRGYSAPALVIEDEAARVPDDVYRAVRPMLAVSQGRIILMSTPFGRKGHFHDTWNGPSTGWLKIFLPATECPRITQDFLDDEMRTLGPLVFGREYNCAFSDNVTQLFQTNLIMRALTSDFPPLFEHLHVGYAGRLH
jgi:hypothetical protein